MNYDKYLEDQRECIESRESDVEKLWLVIEDGREVVWSGNWRESAENIYRAAKENTWNKQFEIGYIWENEFSSDFDYVYRLFNPIKL